MILPKKEIDNTPKPKLSKETVKTIHNSENVSIKMITENWLQFYSCHQFDIFPYRVQKKINPSRK